jgi:hypothetical protein
MSGCKVVTVIGQHPGHGSGASEFTRSPRPHLRSPPCTDIEALQPASISLMGARCHSAVFSQVSLETTSPRFRGVSAGASSWRAIHHLTCASRSLAGSFVHFAIRSVLWLCNQKLAGFPASLIPGHASRAELHSARSLSSPSRRRTDLLLYRTSSNIAGMQVTGKLLLFRVKLRNVSSFRLSEPI